MATSGASKIDILDIDTGAIVGSVNTSCEWPRQLEYHPLRNEVWVHCSNADDDSTPSHLDVFSATSPGIGFQTDISISYGGSVFDYSLGDIGYTTDRNLPYLLKIDLSDKKVISKLSLPDAHGGHGMAYSRANGHIFVRAAVCCTCEADNGVNCGKYGAENVTITTGPLAGKENIPGQCGRCDGLAGVDIIGVYEFNTATDTIVGNHLMKENIGGDPFPSPDGKYIVLIAKNGGTSVRILRTGKPGEKSTVFADLELGFDSRGLEDATTFNDYAFIERGGKSMIVFAAGTENKVAIVDITDGNPRVSYVTLKEGGLTAYKNRRQVEWAVGTDFVWVDGTGSARPREIYIVDIMQEVVVSTVTGITTNKILSVNNYARMNQIETQYLYGKDSSLSVSNSEKINALEKQNMQNFGNTMEPVASAESAASKEGRPSAFGVIGFVLGMLALMVGAINLIFLKKILATPK